jgi:DNA-binding protein H-NS
MTNRYQELKAQIIQLEKEALQARKAELSEVIKTIKKQIADFGLTAGDLGLSTSSKDSDIAVRGKKKKEKGRRVTKAVPPKYRDQAGNVWTGRGKQPLWVAKALASGVTLTELLINK